MAQFTNYLEGKIADWFKGTDMPAAPTSYLGLWDGSPGEDGTGGTEVSTTIGSREAITMGSPADNGTAREIKNSSTVDFGTSAGSATVNAFAVADASTAGNLLFYNTTTSKSINTSDPVTVEVDGLKLGVDGEFTTYLKDQILNWVKGTTMASAPANIYLTVWNGDPLSGGTDVTSQVSAGGREAITLGTVTDGTFSNSVDVDYGNSVNAVTITHAAIYDASTAGNMLTVAAVAATKNINAGDSVKFLAGDIDFTIS